MAFIGLIKIKSALLLKSRWVNGVGKTRYSLRSHSSNLTIKKKKDLKIFKVRRPFNFKLGQICLLFVVHVLIKSISTQASRSGGGTRPYPSTPAPS